MEEKQQEQIVAESLIDSLILFCMQKKLIVFLLFFFIVLWGIIVAPFDWDIPFLPREPLATDAIPDIGENQQIVFTRWMGRSPRDIEDQISYPLTVALLGIPGIKTIRSYSMFGFSSIYIIFQEKVGFYWSRSRVLEKISSLPPGTLPMGVRPTLGPDATALGQIFWYTLEGQDEKGRTTGGWDLDKLRSIQDWYVRYALLSAGGVAEVASVGGFVKEYQIDVNPDAMRAFKVSLQDIFKAVKMSNIDVGARTVEINGVEYVIRGLGYIKSKGDIETTVITERNNLPVLIRDVATVSTGPALRRGALDKGGAEAVGGVVITRYGENPLSSIKNVKKKIAEISQGLPTKTLPDGRKSQVKIVPFYDRTGLIYETLGTLNTALTEEILITVIVVLFFVMHLPSSLLISSLLPLAILMTFIIMKQVGVDANIVSLSGIAIAIGTMVDMAIVMCENILRHLQSPENSEKETFSIIYAAASEVSSAIITAVATTVVSFLPVFSMIAAEGKLFKPLAFTKTFALLASIIVAICIIPPVAHLLFAKGKSDSKKSQIFSYTGLIAIIFLLGLYLSGHWLPLGPQYGLLKNFLFVFLIMAFLLGFFTLFRIAYIPLLRWCLAHKTLSLSLPVIILFLGAMTWLGSNKIFFFVPDFIHSTYPFTYLQKKFPGLGKEFMPSLDEGAYLFMPTTMSHASIGETLDILKKQDIAINAIPEVKEAVGKIGRAETPLDPAPVSMIETVINYHPEFIVDRQQKALLFKYDNQKVDFYRGRDNKQIITPDGKPYKVRGVFVRDADGKLIQDPYGQPFPLWRPALDPALNPGRKAWKGITNPKDIWDEIIRVSKVPGVTSAPVLQPIAARIVMLQSGMRAPMGIKIKGPTLATIEKVGLEIEKWLKHVPSVEPAAVFADRIVGKPYLEIKINRLKAARFGVSIRKVQDIIEIAIGGKRIMTTVEGRERYPVRVRYQRERRDSVEAMQNILVRAKDGSHIPLKQLVQIRYRPGPQVIKSEDTFLIGYVLFDMKPGFAEVDVVEACRAYLNQKIKSGELKIPAGVSYTFAGSFENQVRSEKKLKLVIPVALFIIFIILYLQFNQVILTLLIFSSILVAWAGGFLLLWGYAQPWFLNFNFMGINIKEFFNVDPVNLSVAIWVGFLALFGIASDNGVIMTTFLEQNFTGKENESKEQIREMVLSGSEKRIRPCLMTTATTILALLPVLSSTGRGGDIMGPMAIPTFGGMLVVLITVFTIPTLYCLLKELQFSKSIKTGQE
ncbi:efflux RND transporter permease subunit [Candidatus Riflebacteria bacterium]